MSFCQRKHVCLFLLRQVSIARVLCLSLLICLTGCKKDTALDDYTPDDRKENTGAPVISAVYDGADINLTSPITEGEPGQNLIIVGQNLNNLKSLKFNGIEADLTKTYTMSTKANVTIPSEFSEERINQIEYTTDNGMATYAFVVKFPTLRISHLSNEFAAAGTTVEIVGQNFDYYSFGQSGSNTSVTVNGSSVAVSYVSADALGIEIPAGTPDNSTVTIKWVDFYGVQQTASVAFRPTKGILFADISKAQRDKTDQCVSIEDDSQVKSTKSALGTKHLHFSGTINSYAWVELSFSQNLPDIGDASKVSDYNFIFEVLNAEDHPLLGKGHEFAWNWDWSNSYLWNPGNGYGLNTQGKWKTIRFPLSEIAPNGIGSTGDEMTLNIGFQPSEAYDVDFRMGNFRIQKK